MQFFRPARTPLHLCENPDRPSPFRILDRQYIGFLLCLFGLRHRNDEGSSSTERKAENNDPNFQHPAHRRVLNLRLFFSRNAAQTAEVSKAVNASVVPVCPAGLESITADKIEPYKLKALVGVAHVRTCNMAKHVWLAAASSARACAPEHFKAQIRFCPVIPSNRQFISNLLDVRWLKTHRSFKITTICNLAAIPGQILKKRRFQSRDVF